jgi:hypothetical protein
MWSEKTAMTCVDAVCATLKTAGQPLHFGKITQPVIP